MYDITEGWRLEIDHARMHPGLNHKQMPHSADALVRVDYDALALSATATSWRVFVSEDAPNSAK